MALVGRTIDADQTNVRVTKFGSDAIEYGQGRCLQAVIASAAGWGRGLATTSVIGAEITVMVAAMIAAAKMAAIVFNMTAPCSGSTAGAFRSRHGDHRKGPCPLL